MAGAGQAGWPGPIWDGGIDDVYWLHVEVRDIPHFHQPANV